MEWLTQNWIWVALIVGVIWLLSRSRHGGMMGGCGTHGMAHEGPAGEGKDRTADAPRTPVTKEKAGQAAEGGASTHHRGRGGCC